MDLVVSCIGALSPDIVIHRLTGDGPSNQLISPLWSRAKRSVLNCIHHELKTQGIYQGCIFKRAGLIYRKELLDYGRTIDII